jgi:DNA-binding GntR family transcriptional regulator
MIVTHSGVQWVIRLVPTLYGHTQMFRLTTVGLSSRLKTFLCEHQRIIQVFYRWYVEESKRLMRQHSRNLCDSVMEKIIFFMGDERQTPLKQWRSRHVIL